MDLINGDEIIFSKILHRGIQQFGLVQFMRKTFSGQLSFKRQVSDKNGKADQNIKFTFSIWCNQSAKSPNYLNLTEEVCFREGFSVTYLLPNQNVFPE